jgi:hypothetical protein
LQSFARSPATVGLASGSCSSARAFAPRFFQALPRGECYFTLALRYDFTSIRLFKGTFTLELSNMLGTQNEVPGKPTRDFFKKIKSSWDH